MRVDLFDFDLPQDRIALRPARPRDAARMLVARGNALEDRVVRDLPSCLRPGDVLVFNDTRVIPAQLEGQRGEARIGATLHKRIDLRRWQAFVRNAKRLREGDRIDFPANVAAIAEARHADGGMADMDALDFGQMIEDTHVNTRVVEYRRAPEGDGPGELVACVLIDILADGLSMVYSFYDPVDEARSLGTYVILDHIEKSGRFGLPYLYLGYWVEGSRKMAYKARFMPQDRLGMLNWQKAE